MRFGSVQHGPSHSRGCWFISGSVLRSTTLWGFWLASASIAGVPTFSDRVGDYTRATLRHLKSEDEVRMQH